MSNDATGIDVSLNPAIPASETADVDPCPSIMDTAVRLKMIRDVFGFSQRELAKRAGVTNSSISMIEQGQVSPSIQSLSRILAVFPISMADFFSFKLPADNQAQVIGYTGIPLSPQLDSHTEHLRAGQFTNFSSAAVDSCGVVLEGCLQLTLLTGNQSLREGDSFYIPAGQPFRLINRTELAVSFFLCSLFAHKG